MLPPSAPVQPLFYLWRTPAPAPAVAVITVTPGAALQWPRGSVITLMEAVAVLFMPRGCTSALLFIGKETLGEAPRNTALMPAQAGVHIGHRHRCARALCSTVLHRQAAAAVTVAPVAPGQSGR